MVDIIRRAPTLGDRLAEASQRIVPGAAGALGQHYQKKQQLAQQQQQMAQEDETIERLTGQNVKGLSPDMKKEFVKNFMQQQSQAQKLMGQQQEKNKGLQTAVAALDSLESLIEKPGIGMLGSLNPLEEARRNRGAFESTQAAILPLFKSMFPRGMTQSEFKSIMEHWIPQAGDTEEKIRGKIDGLRMMIQNPESISPDQVLQGPQNEQSAPLENRSRGFSDVRHAGKQAEIKSGTFSKVQKGTPLTKEMAIAMKKKFKGDRKAAEQYAKELGYAVEY